MKEWILGSLKSWSMRFGALLILLPEFWPQIEPHVRELISPDQYHRVLQIIGIAIVLLRAKTTVSIQRRAESGFIRIAVLPVLIISALIAGSLTGCAGLGPRPEVPRGIPEQVEAASLLIRTLDDSVVLLTCTKFELGSCVEPGKPLMPGEALNHHNRLEDAHEALQALSSFGAGQTGECLGAKRTQTACLAAVQKVLLEVDRYLIEKRGGQ